MTYYKVLAYTDNIEEVEVVKVTPSMITIRYEWMGKWKERRERIITQSCRYFPTQAEAVLTKRGWLVQTVRRLKSRALQAQKDLDDFNQKYPSPQEEVQS